MYMLLLMDAHSGVLVHYNNSDEKKKVDKPFTFVQCECRMLEYEHLFHHHPGADSALTQVRPEQHTLISVFKLNSCKRCQFKHLRARGHELARAVRRFVHALQCCQVRGNWATLTLLPRVVFHVRGLKRPQCDPNNVIFSPWNANFTGWSPPKNVYFTPRNAIFTGNPPRNAIGLFLG